MADALRLEHDARRVRARGGREDQARRSFDRVLQRDPHDVGAQINLGQLVKLIRADFLVDATGFNLVRGIPFRASEVADAIDAMVDA